MTLSDKRIKGFGYTYYEEDVKEFIKALKEIIKERVDFEHLSAYSIMDIIDKLAGADLK